MEFGSAAAGSAIVAALVGTIYGVNKCMQRSRCRSHNGCLDISVDRVEQAVTRAVTERDNQTRDLLLQIIQEARKPQRGKPKEGEPEKGEAGGEQKASD